MFVKYQFGRGPIRELRVQRALLRAREEYSLSFVSGTQRDSHAFTSGLPVVSRSDIANDDADDDRHGQCDN
ncbi:hypothetical protein [Cellulomonas xiejunii]|uniref:Uncharacterized protein n=1 Tax=Cellulomonas xiejunii TaxID=2968083 RepID=A0ABY5KT93_9CELL|nr:hypothetical protein [Cellulomonas xiejunii]MCC2323153.1 hypothetical protein [Cellulomonas xiejunii]UUI73640.1 hypothetical protein NP048_09530 [Cellulomonas xiejunii]